jgi:hypothetical protein
MNPVIKKALSLLVVAAFVALPSLAQAKKHETIRGKVTEVNQTSITVSHGKKGEAKTTTVINVPSGAPITDKATGATLQLSDLVGKHVNVKESSPGIAKSVVVKAHKKGKNKSATTSA